MTDGESNRLPSQLPLCSMSRPTLATAFGLYEPPPQVATRGRPSTIHRGAITHRPFRIGHAQRSHDAMTQERAEILVIRPSETCRHAIAEHRHARVAVALIRAGHIQNGCGIPGEGERVVG